MSLKKGMKSGIFRPSLDTQFITLIYNGFRGLRDIELFPPEDYDIDQIIDKFIDYHLRAIVTAKGLKFLETTILQNSMKIKLLLIFWLFFNPIVGQDLPESLTLNEAIEFGLSNNRSIINADREILKAKKERWKTIA